MNRLFFVLASALLLTVSGCGKPAVEFPRNELDVGLKQKYQDERDILLFPARYFSFRSEELKPIFDRIDADLAAYFEQDGYTVVRDVDFDQYWAEAQKQIGGLFDPSTGQISPEKFIQCIAIILEMVKKNEILYSSFVIPSLTIVDVPLQKPYATAKWDGVARTVKYEGDRFQPGKWLSMKGMTLNITVTTRDIQLLYRGKGGIDLLQKGVLDPKQIRLELKSPDEFTGADIREGIEVALHPLIRSERIEAAMNGQ